MNRLSFFYRQEQVYQMSLKALQRRNFSIVEADQEKGIIKASLRGGFLKPGVRIELHIAEDNDRQTSLNISSRHGKKWLAKPDYCEDIESKFVRTLYNCFDMI